MALTIVLSCIGILLGLAPLAIATGRSPAAIRMIYGACLAVSLILFAASFGELIHARAPLTVTLPLGLPWLGVHFRIDALAAFFLTVVNLGASAASLFAVGYGTHEKAPLRVLPFYPAFLAGHESGRPRRRCLHLLKRLGVYVAHFVGAGHVAPSRA